MTSGSEWTGNGKSGPAPYLRREFAITKPVKRARLFAPGLGYVDIRLNGRSVALWEDWKGESSLNHIMFGDVSNWFIQWLGGIGLDPKSPGFKHILIHPQPVGDLTWVKSSHVSPYGTITSAWKRNDNEFKLSISIPPNCTAAVMFPGKHSAQMDVGSGPHEFSIQM